MLPLSWYTFFNIYFTGVSIKMKKSLVIIFLFVYGFLFQNTFAQSANHSEFRLGAENTDFYLPLLKNKRVGLVVNQSSLVGKDHLIDFLIKNKVNVTHLYSPEHGIRGKALAGIKVDNSIDSATKLPITSLYGINKKPTKAQIKDIDVLIFDIQDVGVRYFTYISTMHYVMEAAAENSKTVIILDRPNPNGEFIDGPIMQADHASFVGMHPIPVLHGLTVGELALMINDQGWLKNSVKVDDLHIIKMRNYTHAMPYSLPIKPSPNLPNDLSIRLYPSLGLFESTNISVGRGTEKPFQIIGFNDKRVGKPLFKVSNKGWPQKNNFIYGDDLSQLTAKESSGLNINYYIQWYHKLKLLGYSNEDIINRREWLAKLIGTDVFYQQIIGDKTAKEIKMSWKGELKTYKAMRDVYLLYP